MTDLPQSFMIYKEELRKEKLAKEILEKEYKSKLTGLQNELEYLREKITAQESMMKAVTVYATKIESQLNSLKGEIHEDKSKSYH